MDESSKQRNSKCQFNEAPTILSSSFIAIELLTACGSMSHDVVPLNKAIAQTAAELAIAADTLEHPDALAAQMNLTPNQIRWLRIVRASYDAGDVEVVYSITRNESGNISVAYPPANLGFGVERSRANTVTVHFPRRK